MKSLGDNKIINPRTPQGRTNCSLNRLIGAACWCRQNERFLLSFKFSNICVAVCWKHNPKLFHLWLCNDSGLCVNQTIISVGEFFIFENNFFSKDEEKTNKQNTLTFVLWWTGHFYLMWRHSALWPLIDWWIKMTSLVTVGMDDTPGSQQQNQTTTTTVATTKKTDAPQQLLV